MVNFRQLVPAVLRHVSEGLDRARPVLEPVAAIVTMVWIVVVPLVSWLIQRDIWMELLGETRWLGRRPGLLSLVTVTSIAAVVWLWDSKLLERMRGTSRYQHSWPFFRFLLTFAILGSAILMVSGEVRGRDREPEGVYKLFPQARRYGPATIRTYAANGMSRYSFHDESPSFAPRNGYGKVTFHVYGNSVTQNAGWVIFFQRGENISGFSELRFLIRGEEGDERIGIKAKDAKGVEIELILDDRYLRRDGLSTTWQNAEAVVPLAHFGNVDFRLFENFSFFTTGELGGPRPQTFYVGDFELR